MMPSASGLIWSPGPSRCCAGVVIRDSSAAGEYHVSLDLPPRTVVEDADGGALRIVGPGRLLLASVAAPWAYDAEGNPVAVSQHWDGDGIVLCVQHRGARYPVLADPEFDWGWVSGTLYFTREETRNARDAAQLATMIGTCGHPACRVAAGLAGIFALGAARIYEDGKCLKIKIMPKPGFPPGYLAVPRTTPRGGRNCR